MVPRAGVEPARPYGQRILSPQRLPFRHPGTRSENSTRVAPQQNATNHNERESRQLSGTQSVPSRDSVGFVSPMTPNQIQRPDATALRY